MSNRTRRLMLPMHSHAVIESYRLVALPCCTISIRYDAHTAAVKTSAATLCTPLPVYRVAQLPPGEWTAIAIVLTVNRRPRRTDPNPHRR